MALVPDSTDIWLDARHPIYVVNCPRWQAARDHYLGEVVDKAKITNYLVRKATAEAEAAYLERTQIADYTPHFSTGVDTLAGMLFAVEGEANRFLGDDKTAGLGDAEDEKSPMHRLWRDADGQGTGWLTFFKQLAIDLIVSQVSWIVVDQNQQEQAVLRSWPSTDVVNWTYGKDGQLTEVLLKESIDERTSVKDDIKKAKKETWVLYTMQGWERYDKDERGKPHLIEKQAWGTTFKNSTGQNVLPIFPVRLPIKRNVGWLMAMKANSIFNRESERDMLLRSANFPILVLTSTGAQYKAHLVDIKRGVRALRRDPGHSSGHEFIAPDASSATVATEVLKRKVEEFYITFFKEYGDAAREKTATETKQDVASGVGAFLQMLKSAIDDAENDSLMRVAQIEFPNDTKRWFVNRVERSDTFIPTDVQTTIDALKTRYIAPNQPMPLGKTGLTNLLKQVAGYDGIQVDEDELRSAILTGEYQRLALLFKDLPVPASVRVRMTLELLTTMGLVDPKEMVKMADDTEQKLIEVLEQEMLSLAQADDEARKRMAQPLDDGPQL